MKIVFFSDAHGNQYAVRNFFEQLAHENYDLVIFGGDVFGYYYGQLEILELLQKSGFICLLGNHDRYFLDLLENKIDEGYLVSRYGSTYRNITARVPNQYIDFLYSLKNCYKLTIDNLHIACVHGSVEDPLNGRIYPDTKITNIEDYAGLDYVFMGHTHHKLAVRLENGTVLINPGSIGQQRDGKGCTYVIFDTVSHNYEIKEVQYEREKLISEIKANNEDSIMEQRLIEVLFRKSD